MSRDAWIHIAMTAMRAAINALLPSDDEQIQAVARQLQELIDKPPNKQEG